MNKQQFFERFAAYNEQIEAAVSTQNFLKVVDIDKARRNMLQEYASKTAPDDDQEFFEILEQCAEENARAITKLNSEISSLHRSTMAKVRGLKGYRAS